MSLRPRTVSSNTLCFYYIGWAHRAGPAICCGFARLEQMLLVPSHIPLLLPLPHTTIYFHLLTPTFHCLKVFSGFQSSWLLAWNFQSCPHQWLESRWINTPAPFCLSLLGEFWGDLLWLPELLSWNKHQVPTVKPCSITQPILTAFPCLPHFHLPIGASWCYLHMNLCLRVYFGSTVNWDTGIRFCAEHCRDRKREDLVIHLKYNILWKDIQICLFIHSTRLQRQVGKRL